MMPAWIILTACTSKSSAGRLVEGFTSTRGIVPLLIKGDPLICTDMICASRTFLTIDNHGTESPLSSYTGTYPLGRSGRITITAMNEMTISWTSDVDVYCIFIKGGAGGNSYRYDPPSRSDSGLSTPVDTGHGKPNAFGTITICYGAPAADR